MRTYLKLKCNLCNRAKDVKVDTKAFKFPKCTITLGCSGTLQPFQYTENPDLIPDSPPSGTQNWFPRFDQVTNFISTIPSKFPITFGVNSLVYIAIPEFAQANATSKIALTLEIPTTENKQFREYVFNTTSQVERLLGVESASARKVLRFNSKSSTPEEVIVLRNGELMLEGMGSDNYQISRIENDIQQNAIIFNTPIRGTNQFKIIVSKPVQNSTQQWNLQKNAENITNSICWDNVKSVAFRGQKFQIYYGDFSSTNLPAGKKFSIVRVELHVGDDTIEIPLNKTMVLLTHGPTQIDRVLTKVVRLDTLTSVESPFEIDSVDGVMVVNIDESLLADLQPPLVASTFFTERLLTKSISNELTAEVSNPKIIGP